MKSVRCPKCGREVELPEKIDGKGAFPFCSFRCRDADFNSWADGSYKISRALTEEEFEEIDES